jgi:hypothetical protein
LKSYFLPILCLFYFCELHSQRRPEFLDKLYIELGLNWIDNSGKQDPFYILEDYGNTSFSYPLRGELNYSLSESLFIYASGSTNKFRKGQLIDGTIAKSGPIFISADFGVKNVISLTNSLSIFGQLGLGLFDVQSLANPPNITTSVNIGAGFFVTIMEPFDLVFTTNSRIKFGKNEAFGLTNHFQYSLGVRYSFKKRYDCCR